MANALKMIGEQLPQWWRDINPRKVAIEERGVMRPLAFKGDTRVIDNPDITPADVIESAADIFMPLGFYAGDAEASAAGKAAKGKGAIGKVVNALRGMKANDPITRKDIRRLTPAGEEDIARSLGTDPRLKEKNGGVVPARDLKTAIANRERYRAEPRTLPKRPDEMNEQEWLDFGNQYGADFSVNPMQSLGVSDLRTKRELMVPGGLEGKFTIPDLFNIKANNFDPEVLGQERHTDLMKKFLRTYERDGVHDPVDTFNDLNFSLLSPNAPLTPNQFLAQRFRIRNEDELNALADRQGEPNLSRSIDVESGVGAGARGGLGVKGTANLSNQADLAALIRDKPEMFRPHEGETLRDVGFRVMNQVPGLSVKTASLGVPWTNLGKANTSAVDLHMIRQQYPRLMRENPRFVQRMADLRATNPALSEEEAAIKIVSDHPEMVYRTADGQLHPDLPNYLSPDKLSFEPGKASRPSEYYTDIMRYIDESRGANPEIEMFPEQWRLWDNYRGRVEPHEMAHPDWRKLPKQSWSELQDAWREHQSMGYTPGAKNNPTEMQGDWRKLYYGKIDPRLLGGAGVAGAGYLGYKGLTGKVNSLKTENEDRRKEALRKAGAE